MLLTGKSNHLCHCSYVWGELCKAESAREVLYEGVCTLPGGFESDSGREDGGGGVCGGGGWGLGHLGTARAHQVKRFPAAAAASQAAE